MRILAIILLSICIGIAIGNYAMFDSTGSYFLNMDAWYNSLPVTIFNVVLVVVLSILEG